MLVVHNDDRPGHDRSRVATVLGNTEINISNMDVGPEPERRGGN